MNRPRRQGILCEREQDFYRAPRSPRCSSQLWLPLVMAQIGESAVSSSSSRMLSLFRTTLGSVVRGARRQGLVLLCSTLLKGQQCMV